MDKSKVGSYFDGGLLSLIGWSVLGFFVTICTLGICYPWALCMVYGWKINHTVIEGRRLKFQGKAIGLFGNWIKWFLLCLITVGIYTFWLGIALEKWKVRNTVFVDGEDQYDPTLTEWKNRGRNGEILGEIDEQ